MRISDWSSDVCSSDLSPCWSRTSREKLPRLRACGPRLTAPVCWRKPLPPSAATGEKPSASRTITVHSARSMREPKQVSRPEVLGSGREVPIDGLAVEHREHRFYPRTRRDQGTSRAWRWELSRIICRGCGEREGAE